MGPARRAGELPQRILALSGAVGLKSDLSLCQFAQLTASVLDFAPDLILELGRGMGNSTCAFTEAANQLGGACRVVSICNSPQWTSSTVPRLKSIVPKSWFQPLEAVNADILAYDYDRGIGKARRVILFWDAHGFEIAECVLSVILPRIAAGEHLVFMHDMSDTRYSAAGLDTYGERGLWKGENTGDTRFRVGNVDSAVAQAFVVQDFTGRNKVTLDSADHSIHLAMNQEPGRAEEMRRLLGDDLFSLIGHWFWFTLNEHPGPYTFPRAPSR